MKKTLSLLFVLTGGMLVCGGEKLSNHILFHLDFEIICLNSLYQ